MRNIRRETFVFWILALATVLIPISAVATGSLVSQMDPYSHMESILSGYTPGQVTPALPGSVSDRITSLLQDDISAWTPEGGAYNMDPPLPLNRGTYGEGRLTWDDFFYDPPTCACCG